MTDKEKLNLVIAEIKRLQQKVINGATSGQYSSETIREKNQLLVNLLSFIDSMQVKQVDYGKLQTSLDNALSKETKESWEKFLQEEEKTSVWHDPKDSPKHGSIIVINNDQTTLSVEYVGQPLDGVDKWAYLDELLKL